MKHTPTFILIVLAFGAIFISCNCKKDTSVDTDNNPKIDSRLLAAWYNRTDSVGFEVFGDGSTKSLSVDSAGKLQYMPAKDTLKKGTLILTILKTDGEDIYLKIIYRIPKFIDTTVSVIGQFTIPPSNDTLHLTVPDPTSAKPTPFVYIKSFIGAVVAPKPIPFFIKPRKTR